LVGLTPYKRRDGFRTKKLAGFEPRDLPLAADRAAHAAQKAGSPLPFVLEHLVDHPRLVDEDGLALRLKRSELEVAVRVEDGYALQLVLAGRTLSLDALPGLRPEAGQAAIRLGPVVHLVTVGPVLEGVIKMMGRYGDRFPAAARGPLLERLGLMDRSVPLRLDGSLRGRPLEPDNRPVLLLEPLPEGALRVLVRLEPLPGGPRVVPGHGPSELSVTIDGERRFVERSPSSEPSRVRDALVGLPLPELVDWEGTHELPEDALDLVWALRDNPAVRTLWPKRRLLVRGEGTASQVRASASRRRDWFGVEGELRAEQSVVPLKDLLSAIRAGQRFVELADGSWLRLADGLRKALRDASGLATDEEEPRLPPLAAARAMLALEEAGGDTFVPDELTDLADRIRAADDLEPVTPPGLQATLRDYQLAGVTWLRRLATWAPGAVLADEMGLGKTLQALALILERGGLSLVVAPASVNLNWAREAARFTPGLKVALYRGSDREALLEDPPDILITSYELLIRDLDRLATVRLSTVVFDEAQALKNPRTKRARAGRALDVGFALALSGTPVENDLLELWSLMRVVVPGLLGPKEHFHERFGKKLMRAESMGGGALGGLIRPFLLRRTKREVAPELPERTETVEWIELSSRERVAYDRLRLSAVSAL
ncbi:MAG: DEAD/DEAH box helicase, partial [Myxococcales bacterium]|nr:DEAD/DEAH box helicase [Myxococcales bacterium]